ncbi:MAG: lysophospholipid acyltransferase family protein [Rickettsiales bacterium]|nr:lysophospholipid acyltransferase family protein [Rickettsiales bacterium]
MSLLKKTLKHPTTQALLSQVLAWYIRLVFLTSRKRSHIDPLAAPYMRGEHNSIFAFWHGRMMMLPLFCPPNRPMHVIISLHRDGLLISRVNHHLRLRTIHGSTSRGGRQAMRDTLIALKEGHNVSITPDGPRGPAYQASKGVVVVARLAKKPIIPVTFSSSRHKRFRSWDQFMLALPFGKIEFYVGAPIMVPPDSTDASQEETRMQIENAMNRLVETADGAVAHG